jgi:hypothetical protein
MATPKIDIVYRVMNTRSIKFSAKKIKVMKNKEK